MKSTQSTPLAFKRCKKEVQTSFLHLPYEIYGEILSYFNSTRDISRFIAINKHLYEWSQTHYTARANNAVVYFLSGTESFNRKLMQLYPYVTSLDVCNVDIYLRKLGCCPNVTSLYMKICTITRDYLGGLIIDDITKDILKKIKVLKMIHMCVFGATINLFEQLEDLEIINCFVPKLCLQMSHLRSLIINDSNCKIKFGKMPQLVQLEIITWSRIDKDILKNVPNLKKLRIFDRIIRDENTGLVTALRNNSFLQEINHCKDITELYFTTGFVCQIDGKIDKTRIKVFSCFAVPENIRFIKGMTSLEVLIFDNDEYPVFFDVDYKHIKKMTQLKELQLDGEWCRGNILKNKPLLTKLTVKKNDEITIQDIKRLKGLKVVEVYECGKISMEDIAHLKEVGRRFYQDANQLKLYVQEDRGK